jgi:hypothetical protein
MEKLSFQKIETDLRLLSYQCDELMESKLQFRDYLDFCKEYYHFLTILKSNNWRDPEIRKIINRFPLIEIPPLTHFTLFIGLTFAFIGILIHSFLFIMFFISF